MLTLRDHQSGDLFDPWEYLGPHRRRLLDRSWAGVFREHLLKYLPVQELVPYFQDRMGRPSNDLHAALGALVLQQLHDLTDEQTSEAVALNIAWHYALDIRQESDAYVCPRTLRNDRRRVIEQDLDQVLCRSLADRLIAAVGIDTRQQRLDSTAVGSAILNLTRLGILVEAVSKFLRELKHKLPELHADVPPDLLRKYLEQQGDGYFGDTRPSESQRRLPEAAQDIYELLHRFRPTPAQGLESFTRGRFARFSGTLASRSSRRRCRQRVARPPSAASSSRPIFDRDVVQASPDVLPVIDIHSR